MNHAEHSAKTPSRRNGLFAAFASLLGAKGSGALSSTAKAQVREEESYVRRHAKASSAGSTMKRFASPRRSSGDVRGSGASSHRPGAFLALPLALLAALVALLALVAAPASAAGVHLFKETFGTAAQPSFSELEGIAVDQSTGDLYVVDNGALA